MDALAAAIAGDDLEATAIAIAQEDHACDPQSYARALDALALEIRPRTLPRILRAFHRALGFHAPEDYGDPALHHVDRVVERRTGSPVALAVVLIGVAERCGVTLAPIAFPGHFLARAPDGALIDPCTGATPLPEDALVDMAVRELGLDRASVERMALPAGARTVAIRLLENLEHAYAARGDRASALRVGERLSAVRGPEGQTQRMVASLIRGLLPPKSPRRSLSVQRDGRFFRVDDGPAIDLRRRRALPLLLLRLANHHARSSQGVGWPALVEAGWPGEKIGTDAAWARLRTAIRTLRALGLEGVLITIGSGYLIDPSVDVRWVD